MSFGVALPLKSDEDRCDCGLHSKRLHRGPIRRITCYGAYRCEQCGRKWLEYRWPFGVLSRYAVCAKCQTRELTRLKKIDRLDEKSKNPLRWLLRVFGAPLYHCALCRYQFPDWRGLDPRRRKAR